MARMSAVAEVIALPSAATVFACLSVYEPLGIVNLEAMAVELSIEAFLPADERTAEALRNLAASTGG